MKLGDNDQPEQVRRNGGRFRPSSHDLLEIPLWGSAGFNAGAVSRMHGNGPWNRHVATSRGFDMDCGVLRPDCGECDCVRKNSRVDEDISWRDIPLRS